MRPSRRFSQAISEGAEISLIAETATAEEARSAEAGGAEALLVYSGNERELGDIQLASGLPVLFFFDGEAREAIASVDACVLDAGSDSSWLKQIYWDLSDDFECVVRVEDEDQMRFALDELDPETFLLAVPESRSEVLEHVLSLLSDVPAGKLAIAEVRVTSADELAEFERAGIDAVIVPASSVAEVVGTPPPSV